MVTHSLFRFASEREHYPHGLAAVNPDVKMLEASWGRKKGMKLGISHIHSIIISYTTST